MLQEFNEATHFFLLSPESFKPPCETCCPTRFELGRSRVLQEFDEATHNMGRKEGGSAQQGAGAQGLEDDDDDIVMGGGGRQELPNNRCPITQKPVGVGGRAADGMQELRMHCRSSGCVRARALRGWSSPGVGCVHRTCRPRALVCRTGLI